MECRKERTKKKRIAKKIRKKYRIRPRDKEMKEESGKDIMTMKECVKERLRVWRMEIKKPERLR